VKTVNLSALGTGRLYPSPQKMGGKGWYSFLLDAESPQGHSAAGRIMSMKNYSDTVGNWNRELPASTNCAIAYRHPKKCI